MNDWLDSECRGLCHVVIFLVVTVVLLGGTLLLKSIF